jgi:SAM-dependent methyltransferase
MDDRAAREQAFHDARFGAEEERASDRFYSITERSRAAYDAKLATIRPGMRVLEFGCGPYASAYALAARGVRVSAIDISPVAIELAKADAARLGLQIDFAVMNAEALSFPDENFDVVCGSGILHHLELQRSFRELTRVLAPGGWALFSEPLGHNPLVNWYRSRTPEQRTEDEHPLLLSDFELARSFFSDVKVSYYHLATLAALPACTTPFVKPLCRVLDDVDRALFTVLPAAKRLAWVALVELLGPKVPVHLSAGRKVATG